MKKNIKIQIKIKQKKFLKFLLNVIFCFIYAGPITELNTVPGNDPIEKQAKNTPA